jgi:hypothetical protein
MSELNERLRLGAATHRIAKKIDSRTSAEQLYRDAAAVAEQRVPGQLGTVLAAVLIEAAELRKHSGMRGSLGAPNSMLALAVIVSEANEL